MLTALFALLSLLWLQPTPPASGISTTGSADSPSILLTRQRSAAAARLGLSPLALTAAGYSSAEAASILATLQQSGAFASARSRCLDKDRLRHQAGTSSLQAPGPARSDLAAERGDLLAAAIADNSPGRAAALERAVAGVKAGLPGDVAQAAATMADRRVLAGALLAERRAARLGRTPPGNHGQALADARSSAGAAAARSRIQNSGAAVRAAFAAPVATP